MKTYLPPQNSLSVSGTWWMPRSSAWSASQRNCHDPERENKPEYTPHMDTGGFVIVVNADKVRVTGKKRTQKVYRRHSDAQAV